MLVDAFNYTVPSLLNQFLCDNAIIDKTLFYDITTFLMVPNVGICLQYLYF